MEYKCTHGLPVKRECVSPVPNVLYSMTSIHILSNKIHACLVDRLLKITRYEEERCLLLQVVCPCPLLCAAISRASRAPTPKFI